MEVGDYVRSEEGIIAQCYKYEATTYFFDKCLCLYHGDYLNYIRRTELKNIIKKSSPNIIDLIEVGDYVNGIYIEKNNGKYLETLEDDYDNSRLGHIEFIKIYPNEIKSILTKEQFESMEYKVEGSDKE